MPAHPFARHAAAELRIARAWAVFWAGLALLALGSAALLGAVVISLATGGFWA